MPRLVFTPQLRRFLTVPDVTCPAASLRQALDMTFADNPQLRGYVLDDQGWLRAHVVVFVDGRRLTDRQHLDVPLQADSVVHVMQALSGG